MVSSCTLLTTFPPIFSTHLPLADCLHEEMSLYFASSIDLISLAMPTPTEDDEAVDAMMGDQDEVNAPDPMNLGDQLALRDAVHLDGAASVRYETAEGDDVHLHRE